MFTKEELIEIRNLIDGSKDKLTDETSRIRNSIGSKIFSKLHSCSQEEPVGEDLERASRKYEETRSDIDAVSDNQVVRRAFKAGAAWYYEQIMKEALNAVISQVPCSNDIIFYNPASVDRFLLPQEMNKRGFKKGDKVKLIIIKDE